jgi:CheY-like chemotaxis protein
MKILIVEDQLGQVMLRVFKVLFPSAETRLALNGVDGLKQYKQFQPDLVFTDWNMPRMNGGEMTELIRELNPNQKTILWSASLRQEFTGYLHLFDQILSKDVDLETLKDAITGVMHHASLASGE